MRFIKKIVVTAMAGTILFSTTILANAEASQSNLQTNAELINQKTAEKETISKELRNVQNDLTSIESEVTKNKEELAAYEQKAAEVQQLIEKKKEEIVVLEDKVLSRTEIMKKRLVSLQHSNQANLIIEIIVNSENFTELIERATAVSTVLSADKDLLEQQKSDLKQIEKDKAEISKQEKVLEEQTKILASKQVTLDQNLQKRQAALTAVQEKYNKISSEISLAEKEKAAIEEQIGQAQAKITQGQQASQTTTYEVPANNTYSGKELYVTATAYSHEDTSSDVTSLGYNIRVNANMKLIAVDPSVIPLGSRVWVEGYGEAIAGDTGGAIKGHKIDVLMPSSAAAKAWGRKTVKIVILN